MQPNTPSDNRKVIVIAALIALVLLVIGIVALSLTSKKKPTATAPQASSSATPTPSPDIVAQGPEAPAFFGFDKLLDTGISSDQVDGLKFALTKYVKSTGHKVTETTLDPNSISVTPHDPNSASTTDSVIFVVSFDNGNKYPAKLEYTGFTAMRLYLNNPANTAVIFDSGPIDLYNSIGTN